MGVVSAVVGACSRCFNGCALFGDDAALAARGTVAGHRLGALEEGGGGGKTTRATTSTTPSAPTRVPRYGRNTGRGGRQNATTRRLGLFVVQFVCSGVGLGLSLGDEPPPPPSGDAQKRGGGAAPPCDIPSGCSFFTGPSRAPSLCPAAVSLAASAASMVTVTGSDRPRMLWQPPPTAYLTAPGAPSFLMHPSSPR